MSEPSSTALLLWLTKLTGAVAGSAISLAYVFPRSRREAALRFLTGLSGGLAFGTTAGVAIAAKLEITGQVSELEIALMGSAFSSTLIWWVMGYVLRLIPAVDAKQESKTDGAKTDE